MNEKNNHFFPPDGRLHGEKTRVPWRCFGRAFPVTRAYAR